jgi:Mediator complex protein
MSLPTEGGESTFTPFTTAERIQQLNDIDKSITALLHSAGLALQTLSTSAKQSSASTIQNKREAFQEISNTYLRTLQSVDVRLRRQIYGLEEGDIIPGEKIKAKTDGQDAPVGGMAAMMAGQGAGVKEETLISVGEGGMGKLDIGWLNSRSRSVDQDMEAELWARARAFLERLEKTAEDGTDGQTSSQDIET